MSRLCVLLYSTLSQIKQFPFYLFVNFNVPLNKIWEVLEKSTINTSLIEAIKLLYKGCSSKIRIGNLTTKGFKVTEGLRQDCSLPPTLFKVYLERVLRNWKRKCQPMGIPIQNTYVCIFTQFCR